MCACNLLRGCREETLPARSGSLTVSAQVGEWLKPADCKSAPPSGVRRFESFPVHQRFFVNRLLVAFAAFAILAGLAWTTLPDDRIRAITLAIVGLFAVKTWLHRKALSRPPEE